MRGGRSVRRRGLHLLLLSDGAPTKGDLQCSRQVASALRLGVSIHTCYISDGCDEVPPTRPLPLLRAHARTHPFTHAHTHTTTTTTPPLTPLMHAHWALRVERPGASVFGREVARAAMPLPHHHFPCLTRCRRSCSTSRARQAERRFTPSRGRRRGWSPL